jgi:hypothetical protein
MYAFDGQSPDANISQTSISQTSFRMISNRIQIKRIFSTLLSKDANSHLKLRI